MSTVGGRIAPEGAHVERWQAPAVGASSGRPGERRAAEGLLTAEKLAAIEEQAREAGYRAGFDEGRQAGLEAGRDELERNAAVLAGLLESISPQLTVLDNELLEQVGALVLAVAKQFVRRELSHEPGEVVRVVREALAALPASEARVRVHLNPEDAALVQQILPVDTLERPLQIVEDMTLSRGGARVETDSSLVDASVERRLSVIAARLLGDDRRSAEARDDE